MNAMFDAAYTRQEFPLGHREKMDDGREYVFCKYNAGDGAADASAGQIGVLLDSAYSRSEVTNDVNSATIAAINATPVGIFLGTISDGEYCWLQARGKNKEAMTTDGDVAQGDRLMVHATTTGGVDTHDDTSKPLVGVALEDDSGTSLAAGTVDLRM